MIVVCYTAVFRAVTQRSSRGALRDDTKNGCAADYSLIEVSLYFSSLLLCVVGRQRRKKKRARGARWESFLFFSIIVILIGIPSGTLYGGKSYFSIIKVTRPSFFGAVPSYFEALWYPHQYFYHKSNT